MDYDRRSNRWHARLLLGFVVAVLALATFVMRAQGENTYDDSPPSLLRRQPAIAPAPVSPVEPSPTDQQLSPR